ncbi:Astacin (Peptidase family M12A) [Paenibacillus algorifonticola]|uniref:Astacin (Peptidase family M12A) n=1 Tax=Paenibacillus algorifonticola TaxID=684063 RepID=A0A1I2F761_9BACL|nr:M12 family metallopeptidase [Paenibacillus algorifonticola]SFF00588.1 Astacin (Peptidase family M12A) [Paenibacillus algorifonticola]
MAEQLPEVYANDLFQKGTAETGYVYLADNQTPVKVEYIEYDNLAIVDGDIVVAEAAKMRRLKAFIEQEGQQQGSDPHVDIIIDMRRLWPRGKVFYAFDANVPASTQQDIKKAMSAIAQACPGISFSLRGTEPNYVLFKIGLGHSSYVGMIGGKQLITLGVNYVLGNIIHEIGHTLGLLHEHTKPNRDTYITVSMGNIPANKQSNFVIINHPELFKSLKYDWGSIMHYSKSAFAIDPTKPTITPTQALPSGTVMGQRTALSALDVEGINALYTTSGAAFEQQLY